MKILKTAIFAGMLAFSSMAIAKPAADGYSFEQAEYFKSELQVSIKVFKTKKEWEAHLREKGMGDDLKIFGYSEIRPNSNVCTIYILDPRVRYQPEDLGHEMAHCIFGRFHPRQLYATPKL